MLTVYTFGDSILDCGHYNDQGIHPAQLILQNDDRLFPEFRGLDLTRRLGPVRLDHRAVDGSMVGDLARQADHLPAPSGDSLALVTIGGNDLIAGLLADPGPGIDDFACDLHTWLQNLPIRPVLIGTVYDPTFGDDALNSTGVDSQLARENFRKLNDCLIVLGQTHGFSVDLHAHFLQGRPDWLTRMIEPSLVGASEIRRCFWQAIATERGWSIAKRP